MSSHFGNLLANGPKADPTGLPWSDRGHHKESAGLQSLIPYSPYHPAVAAAVRNGVGALVGANGSPEPASGASSATSRLISPVSASAGSWSNVNGGIGLGANGTGIRLPTTPNFWASPPNGRINGPPNISPGGNGSAFSTYPPRGTSTVVGQLSPRGGRQGSHPAPVTPPGVTRGGQWAIPAQPKFHSPPISRHHQQPFHAQVSPQYHHNALHHHRATQRYPNGTNGPMPAVGSTTSNGVNGTGNGMPSPQQRLNVYNNLLADVNAFVSSHQSFPAASLPTSTMSSAKGPTGSGLLMVPPENNHDDPSTPDPDRARADPPRSDTSNSTSSQRPMVTQSLSSTAISSPQTTTSDTSQPSHESSQENHATSTITSQPQYTSCLELGLLESEVNRAYANSSDDAPPPASAESTTTLPPTSSSLTDTGRVSDDDPMNDETETPDAKNDKPDAETVASTTSDYQSVTPVPETTTSSEVELPERSESTGAMVSTTVPMASPMPASLQISPRPTSPDSCEKDTPLTIVEPQEQRDRGPSGDSNGGDPSDPNSASDRALFRTPEAENLARKATMEYTKALMLSIEDQNMEAARRLEAKIVNETRKEHDSNKMMGSSGSQVSPSTMHRLLDTSAHLLPQDDKTAANAAVSSFIREIRTSSNSGQFLSGTQEPNPAVLPGSHLATDGLMASASNASVTNSNNPSLTTSSGALVSPCSVGGGHQTPSPFRPMAPGTPSLGSGSTGFFSGFGEPNLSPSSALRGLGHPGGSAHSPLSAAFTAAGFHASPSIATFTASSNSDDIMIGQKLTSCSPSGNLHTCNICGFQATTKFHINSHMNTHFDHKCRYCDYTSRTEGRLKAHMKNFHTHPQPSNAMNNLESLDALASQLSLPTTSVDSGGMTPNMSVGDMDTRDTNSRDVSSTMGSPGESPEEFMESEDEPGTFVSQNGGLGNLSGKPKSYKCKQCMFVAQSKDDYWRHARTHIKQDKQLKCTKCLFVTEYKHHLEYHLRNHYGSKPFRCSKCNYSCVNKSMLNSHMKSHSNFYPYRCANCTYATKYCHSLKLHLRKYNHTPATVVNPDGSTIDATAIDVYGNRRGPRQRRLSDATGPGGMPQNQMADMVGSRLLPSFMEAAALLAQHSTPDGSHHPLLGNSIPTLGATLPTISSLGMMSGDEHHQQPLLPPTISGNDYRCSLCEFKTNRRDELTIHLTAHFQGSGGQSTASQNHPENPVITTVGMQQRAMSDSGVSGVVPSTMSFGSDYPPRVKSEFRPGHGADGDSDGRQKTKLEGPLSLLACRGPRSSIDLGHPSSRENSPNVNSAPTSGTPESGHVKSPGSGSGSGGKSGDESVDGATSALMGSGASRRKGKAFKLDRIALKLKQQQNETAGTPDGAPGNPDDSQSPKLNTGAPVSASEFAHHLYSSMDAGNPSGSDFGDETGGSGQSTASQPGGVMQATNVDWNGAFVCGHCEMAFRDMVMYSLHMGYHGYQDPYRCNMCGKACHGRVELFLHIAKEPHYQI